MLRSYQQIALQLLYVVEPTCSFIDVLHALLPYKQTWNWYHAKNWRCVCRYWLHWRSACNTQYVSTQTASTIHDRWPGARWTLHTRWQRMTWPVFYTKVRSFHVELCAVQVLFHPNAVVCSGYWEIVYAWCICCIFNLLPFPICITFISFLVSDALLANTHWRCSISSTAFDFSYRTSHFPTAGW